MAHDWMRNENTGVLKVSFSEYRLPRNLRDHVLDSIGKNGEW